MFSGFWSKCWFISVDIFSFKMFLKNCCRNSKRSFHEQIAFSNHFSNAISCLSNQIKSHKKNLIRFCRNSIKDYLLKTNSINVISMAYIILHSHRIKSFLNIVKRNIDEMKKKNKQTFLLYPTGFKLLEHSLSVWCIILP